MDSIVLKAFDSDSATHAVQTITVDDVMYFRAKDIADLYKEVGRERACKALNYLQGL